MEIINIKNAPSDQLDSVPAGKLITQDGDYYLVTQAQRCTDRGVVDIESGELVYMPKRMVVVIYNGEVNITPAE